MLMLAVLALLLTSVVLLAVKRNRESLCVFALCGSLALFIITICIFIAKRGGVTSQLQLLLFLTDSVKNWLRYLMVTLNTLGYLMAVGRFLFPYFFLLIGLYYSMVPFVRKCRWLPIAAGILPVISLVLYSPPVFQAAIGLLGNSFVETAVFSTRIWVVLYVLLGGALCVIETISITMPFCRRQFMQKLMFLAALAVLYLLYSQQDPAQVYLFYKNDYMSLLGLWYLSPQLHLDKYFVSLALTAVFGIVGFIALLKYTQLNLLEDQNDVVMKRKFDAANQGASVFVHSVKNQLLANRVVYKRLNAIKGQSCGENEQELWRYITMLEESNGAMLNRMEDLYASVKSKSIYLCPVDIGEILELAEGKFRKKYPDGNLAPIEPLRIQVLADKVHLSEALYNLLTNAWEAELMMPEQQPVEVVIHQERRYTVLEVRDHGPGIEKSKQTKIFEPFYSSKNTNFNWGMGLYHVRAIVKSHLGSLRVESKPGKGTAFLVLLPRYAAPQDKGG